MLVISNNLVLSQVTPQALHLPFIGWRNVIRPELLSADGSDPMLPVINLGNPSTALLWKGEVAGEQAVTVTLPSLTEIDYAGIVGHNFGSARIEVALEGLFDDWEVIADPVLPSNDRPLLFRFPTVAPNAFRFTMLEGDEPPEMAVPYAGRATVVEHGMAVPYTPLRYGRTVEKVTGRSQSGNFLGTIVTGQTHASAANFEYFSMEWVERELKPFLDAAVTEPFFFAWRPLHRPQDVGFAWLQNDPRPDLENVELLRSIQLDMEAIV